jgi:hypothetical protein
VLNEHGHQRRQHVDVASQVAFGFLIGAANVVIGHRDILSDASRVRPGQ